MTIFQAFFGGFSSFFSVWIFCLMQVIPFFLALTAGLLVFEKMGENGYWKRVLYIAILPLVGFIIVFTLTGMSTTSISRAIFRHNELLNRFGGVIIGLTGLYLIGLLTIKDQPMRVTLFGVPAVLLLFGASMAVAYKPCVTPTLTAIFALNGSAETAGIGAVMLVFYTLGTTSAILGAEILLLLLCSRANSDSERDIMRKLSGAVVLAASILILSGQMTNYKSFLVGRFVPDDTGHNGHHHDMGNMEKE